MKSILAVLVLGLSANAFAATADQMTTLYKCERSQMMPDNGLEVLVTEGGLAGLTQVQVFRSFLAHSFEKTYIVKELPQTKGLLGAPVVYEGQGIRLSINFTTAPLANGGHIGSLETQDNGTEELNCVALMHTL